MGRLLLPFFVFVFDGKQQKFMYDVLHERWMKVTHNSSFEWLCTTFSIQALYMDWLLLLHLEGYLSVFHPPTDQQLLLPLDQSSMPDPTKFIYRFSTEPPDGHVVAFHKTDHYFRVCGPGVDERWSPMHELHIPRVGDLDGPQLKHDRYIQDAVLCNGKLYALTNTCIVVLEGIGGAWHRPKATYLIYEHVLPYFDLNFLVESEGELYLAWKSEKHANVFGVQKWQFSSESWKAVTSIGNKVFMLGTRYSASLPANAAIGLVAGMVYFLLEDYGICSFNIQCWSLTTHYPRQDFEYNYGDWV